MRSLGQAFDVCHKLNPKPQKKKKGAESSADAADTPTEGQEAEEGEENGGEVTKEDLGTSQPSGNVPASWKQFNTNLDSALATSEPGGGVVADDKTIADLNKDLMQLNFDPFSVPVSNGNPLSMDPFQPLQPPHGGDAGAVAYPPLTVSNTSTGLPDFPDGVDPATASANVPPPHMALLGRPRPRASVSGQQQVRGAGESVWRGKCVV